MKRALSALSGLMILSLAAPVQAQNPAQNQPDGRAIFAEADAACRADGGALWGVSLCGPLLIVDPRSRQAAANQAADGLAEAGGVFSGVLPADLPLANGAMDWAGARWAVVLAPLPDDARTRRVLLMHEAWHRIQPELGLTTGSIAPAHLATPEGRVLMRLEWRALGSALIAADAVALRVAIRDALTFRAARRAQAGDEGAAQERARELDEGLAEYTGVMLSGDADMRRDTALMLRMAEQADDFPEVFAFASGPAYGLLLDELSPGWRAALTTESDLGDLLGALIQFETPSGDWAGPVQEAGSRHGAAAVADQEADAAGGRATADAHYRTRLVEGATLSLPFVSMRIQFDPDAVTPLPPHGVVYPTLTVTDAWGELTVTDGALIGEDLSSVIVPAPADATARSGDGWNLKLNDGWRLAPGGRAGDFRVERGE